MTGASTPAPAAVAEERPTPLPAPTTGPREIRTLPPLAELEQQRVPISPATGQPRRAVAMVVADVFLYGASVVSAAALCWSWWRAIHVHSFAHSSQLVQWWQPRPGGWRSIVAVVVIALAGAAMATAPAVAAFNAWNGHRWSRVAALVAVAVGCLAALLGGWAWAAPVLSLVGAVVLHLPPVTRYFEHWRRFRAGTPQPLAPERPVTYGPARRATS